jgi:L-aminopeptidase/D-esterase-like protein
MPDTKHDIRVGPRNLITDVDGLKVGNAVDPDVRTGVSVLLPDAPAVAGVDVRGGGPGTRATDAMDPTCLVEEFHGFFLSGGSEFGLASGDGVANWLSAKGKGLVMGAGDDVPTIPVVPGAILFDLANGGDKKWGLEPPYRRLAMEACENAGLDFVIGNVGAGLGAIAGKIKGGLGSASSIASDGLQVGALVAANPVGSPLMPGTNCFWGWPLEQAHEFGGARPPADMAPVALDMPMDSKIAGNTTIAIVATNMILTRAQAQRVAIMAQDGFARAVRPIHTPFDGDVIFALSTGKMPMGPIPPLDITRIGMMAADCVTRAIGRGVFEADGLAASASFAGVQSYREKFR